MENACWRKNRCSPTLRRPPHQQRSPDQSGGGHPRWTRDAQPLLCPWTSLLPGLPSPPASGANRRLHWAPGADCTPAPLAKHGLPPDTFSPSLVLLPNSYPALEFFMGFYLVLTRLHGPWGPRFFLYFSPSQAQDGRLVPGPPALSRPAWDTPSPRVGFASSFARCCWAQAPPQPPSQLLEHYSQGCFGVGGWRGGGNLSHPPSL